MVRIAKACTLIATCITIVSCAHIVSKAPEVETPPMSFQEKLTIIEYVRNGGEGVVVDCQEFIMPVMGNIPQLPELSQRDLNDRYLVEEKLTDHIAELREYVITQKARIKKEYLEYVRKCNINNVEPPKTIR